MKKTFLSLAVALTGCFALSGCGTLGTPGAGQGATIGGNQSIMNGSNTMSVIGNLISTFAGGILTNQSSIVGTWTYSKPCVQFESQNLLTQAGGSVAASNMEGRLNGIYSALGIKPGSTKFTFNKNGNMSYTIGGRTMTGTYTFNSANKTITITTKTGMQITAYVSVAINQLGLTFDTTKLLQLVGGASSLSSSLSTISSLASSFNGMKMGFTFTK